MRSIIVNMVPEETCMAVLEDGELQAVEMERSSHSHLVGNIYKGRVQNVLPGMQAAFVDIGTGKNAFLYIGDGLPHETIESMPQNARIHIGQSLPIQIVKDAIGTKGPRATIEEAEADEFALNAILPNAEWKKFMAKTRDVVPYKIAPHILAEANKYNVNPQLLFGRYKHDIGIYKIKRFFETKIL